MTQREEDTRDKRGPIYIFCCLFCLFDYVGSWLHHTRPFLGVHGLSSCGARAQRQVHGLSISSCGLWAQLPLAIWGLNSLTRDWTHIPWMILNHWTTREVPPVIHFTIFYQKYQSAKDGNEKKKTSSLLKVWDSLYCSLSLHKRLHMWADVYRLAYYNLQSNFWDTIT